MIYIKNFFFAYLATIGFAILFNTPKSALIRSGFGGAIGWVIYLYINNVSNSIVLSTFIASLCIAFTGEVFAIIEKKPITIYIIPGIFPLVPGFGLYYTMLSIIEKNYDLAAEYGSTSLLIAVSISAALTIILSLNSYRKQRKKFFF